MDKRTMRRDKLALLAIFIVALAVGLCSVGYHHFLSARAIRWWGDDAVGLIITAPKVEALMFRTGGKQETGSAKEPIAILHLGHAEYAVLAERNVTANEAVYHLRHGLVEDPNFDWSSSTPAGPARFGLRFSNGPNSLTVVFDETGQHLTRADTGATLTIAPSVTGWREFFTEQFGEQGTEHAAPHPAKH